MADAERELSTVIVHRPAIGEAEIAAVTGVCESGWFGMGELTLQFEDRLQALIGVRHAIGVQSGTAALHLALEAVGVGQGDEVIVPSFTFAASVQAIVMTGGRPVFCDIEPDTLTLDVADALARVTPATKAILPVDYGGVACDYEALVGPARERGLAVVADAAHSFGSTYHGAAVGTLADVTCFSFDASKNITCGDGGAIMTDDDDVARRCRTARNIGIEQDSWGRRNSPVPWYYEVTGSGYRYRLGNLNAAIGLAQLDRLEEFRERKRTLVRRYDEALAESPGVVLPERRLEESFPFLYPIRIVDGRRDALIEELGHRRVQVWVHFIPNHLQPAFADFPASLPVTEQIYAEIASLPLHVELTDEEFNRVVEGVRSFLGTRVPA
jgi:perosamine synthetase